MKTPFCLDLYLSSDSSAQNVTAPHSNIFLLTAALAGVAPLPVQTSEGRGVFRFQVFWIECLAAIGVVPEDRLGGVDAKAQTMIGGMYLMGRGALLWNFGVPGGI